MNTLYMLFLYKFCQHKRYVAIGNFGGLLEGISMVAQQASGNKINNIMVVRKFIIFSAIKNHTGSPITIGNVLL